MEPPSTSVKHNIKYNTITVQYASLVTSFSIILNYSIAQYNFLFSVWLCHKVGKVDILKYCILKAIDYYLKPETNDIKLSIIYKFIHLFLTH